MPKILAIYGSPRRGGNTSTLLDKAVEGATDAGCSTTRLYLRDLRMSPCLEIYGCKETGRCVIDDDFQKIHDLLARHDALMLASPIFFYTVSAHTKILMDRCQSFWVKKHWIDEIPPGTNNYRGKGLFIAAGASGGQRLFDGARRSVKYFFDALDIELCEELFCRGLDFQGDVLKHPELMDAAFAVGKRFGTLVREDI